MIYDAIIIGAGAAGLAAARGLLAVGRRVVVLEARDRIGGRIWTDHTFGPVPVERGAEFIHGARAGTWAWLRQARLEAMPFERWKGRRIALGNGRLAGPWLLRWRPDLRRIFSIESEIAAYDGPDCSLADWLKAHGYSPLAAHLADLRVAHAACVAPADLSIVALADELRNIDRGPGDFHITAGYDRVLATIAEGLDIQLNTPVSVVRWGPDGVEVETSGGIYNARAVVVTLPLAVLKAGVVRFDPVLPQAKREAIDALMMLPAMKLLFRFSEPFWDRDMTFLSGNDPVPVWWTNRPDVPLLTAFLTGPRAARMSAYGRDGALERGLSALESIFGPAARRLFVAADVVDWGQDVWARGGYSAVPPGAYGRREVLAKPEGALYFAGEAVVTNDNPATVHGARTSGQHAATAIIAATGG